MINNPSVQPANFGQYNPQTLPDATDRASEIVGFDINNYVFGHDTYTKTLPSSNQNQQNLPSANNIKKENNKFSAILLLGMLSLGAFAAYKGLKGSDIKLPETSKIKETFTGFIETIKNKFKKPKV